MALRWAVADLRLQRWSLSGAKIKVTLHDAPLVGSLSRPFTSASRRDKGSKPHYTTTPIFYVNAAPHIGHLHSAVLADVFSRWAGWRNKGWSTVPENGMKTDKTKEVLATGTDEHGIKIQRAAASKDMDPRHFCDQVSQKFKILTNAAGVEYTRFIRTTDTDHVEAVKHLWTELEQRGHIYKGTHEGWYAVSDEAYYTSTQIKPSDKDTTVMIATETGSVVEWSSEENYKFRLSAFQQPLLNWLESFPDAIVPTLRKAEVIAEIKEGLSDLSVSRPKSRLHWGISVPSDDEHTMYVWLDALTNYLTVAGYPWKGVKDTPTKGCWPVDVQVIGKDIVRFHAIYFPAMLLALDLPLPKHLVTHGHWTMNKLKMSKSRGNVADPFEAIQTYGRDELRWLLCRIGGNLGADADWTDSTMKEFHRKYLSGQWGNLASRILSKKILKRLPSDPIDPLCKIVEMPDTLEPEDSVLVEDMKTIAERVDKHMSNFEVNRALETISDLLARSNEHLSLLQPWLPNTARGVVVRATYLTIESLRIAALLARPVLPSKMDILLKAIQAEAGQEWVDALHLRDQFVLRPAGKLEPIIPRLDAPLPPAPPTS